MLLRKKTAKSEPEVSVSPWLVKAHSRLVS